MTPGSVRLVTIWTALGLTIGLASIAPLAVAVTSYDPLANSLAVVAVLAVYAGGLLLTALLLWTLDHLAAGNRFWWLLLPLAFTPMIGANRLPNDAYSLHKGAAIIARVYGD